MSTVNAALWEGLCEYEPGRSLAPFSLITAASREGPQREGNTEDFGIWEYTVGKVREQIVLLGD